MGLHSWSEDGCGGNLEAETDGQWPLVRLGKYLLTFDKTLQKHLPASEHFAASTPQNRQV